MTTTDRRPTASVLSALLAALVAPASLAAELVVPDQFTTVQAAIDASVNGDTVLVRAGTYITRLDLRGRRIHLKSELGPAATFIDPQGQGGVVINCDEGETNQTIIEGFTVRNGLDSGIYISGSSPVIKNCRFVNNQASRGGGAHVRAGADVTFEGCQFTGNQANSGDARGGALYAESCVVVVRAGQFSTNTTTAGTSYSGGGGVWAATANLTIEDSEFRDNSTNLSFGNCFGGTIITMGGAIGGDGTGTITSRRNTFLRNSAFAFYVDSCGYTQYAIGAGGAIASSGNVRIVAEDCDFNSNVANGKAQNEDGGFQSSRAYGGSIYAAGNQLEVRRCSFTSSGVHAQTAQGSDQRLGLGSDVFAEASAACEIQGSTFSTPQILGDSATRQGGAIFCNSSLKCDGCSFSNYAFGTGGAIHLPVASVTELSNCQFSNCGANETNGGAIWLTGGTRTFTNCDFTNCIAQGSGDHRGGAVYGEGGAVVSFTDCDFTGNRALSSGDNADRPTRGGATGFAGCTPRYTRCNFSGNYALSTGNGGGTRYAHGGATWEYDSDALYTDCRFANNKAETAGNGGRQSYGGSIYLWNSDTDFVRCVFDDGRALPTDTDALGGAVYMENISRPGFSYCTITGCDAANGAGLFIRNSEPYVVSTGFRQNVAVSGGGGMYVDNASTPYVIGCSFEANNAPSGGAVKTTGTGTNLPFIVNSSFCGNQTDTIAGSILGGSGNVTSAQCSTDCNSNGIPDATEIADGTATDVDSNGVPDSCQSDCNGNGTPDAYELAANTAPDCNGNGRPDSCDIASSVSLDSNANGTPDECELTSARLVPFEYPNITAAINAAVNGDTVYIAPGAYYEKFNLGNKQVTLKSVGGADVTYIDGNGINGTLLTVNGGQTASTVIDGFTFWYAQGGHGLYIQNASPTVRNCRFLFNTVADGAALRIESPSSASIEDCVVESNTATTSGGGVYSNTNPTFTRVTFRSNTANDDGGAARLVGGSPRFIDCSFESNRAIGAGDHRGGAVCASSCTNLSFVGCAFSDNLAQSSGDNADRFGFGGAVAVIDCVRTGATPPQTFDNCTFDGNRAKATGNGGGVRYAKGGAVWDWNSDTSHRDCTYSLNIAETSSNGGRSSTGGAFWAALSNPTIVGSEFLQNSTVSNSAGESWGGGAHFEQTSNGTIDNCAFESNSALRGGGLHLTGNSQPNVRNTSFKSNTASSAGGGAYCNGSPAFFFTCDFRQNSAPSGSALATEGTSVPNVYGTTFCGNPGTDVAGNWFNDQNTISDLCNDCNGNQVDDAQDIAKGTSADCNLNEVPDECDLDSDQDGTINACDGCPNDPAKTAPGACGCGQPETDSDSDGTPDCVDGCPNDPLKSTPGSCGCGQPDSDSDGDGVADCSDGCPSDPGKTTPGACGCGQPDADSDGDGTADCIDGCPNDSAKTTPGQCGCGQAELDADQDGTPDCIDGCPNDPLKSAPGACGCGQPDTDSDGDSVPDCTDNCDSAANADQADCNGDGVGDACEQFTDCNRNGRLDECEIADGTAADVDADGRPDACEPDCNGNARPDDDDIATGAAADCNLNAIPDSCDLEKGSALDSDGDGLLDECESDCNDDGILDAEQIAAGAIDCDANGILDECQDRSVRASSGMVAPFGGGFPATAMLSGLAPATADVTVTVSVRADLGAVNEFVSVKVNGGSVGNLFVAGGGDCPASPDRATLIIPAATWNALASETTATVRLEAPATVGAGECASWAIITVRVVTAAADCDLDGVTDLCEIASGSQSDCDGDRRADECSVASGSAPDCNANALPDSCDIAADASLDCDLDGIVDSCAVQAGTVPDCDGNGIPDSCDLTAATRDCDSDGSLDSCEIASGAEADCDGNGIPDGCDLASGAALDCNGNQVPDSCDVASGTSADVDANGIPDECKDDCNGNLLPDGWEIEQGIAPDCNANAIPDGCDIAARTAPDCNRNGVPDACDIAGGAADLNGNGIPDSCDADCNANGVPDDYEVSSGLTPDCNANGLPDACDVSSGTAPDCNSNGVPDGCDIASGADDEDGDGTPDSCEYARGDFDLDGVVGGSDLGLLLALWAEVNPPIGDLNEDGVVNGADLGLLLNSWGD